MNKDEYLSLNQSAEVKIIKGADLENKADRTLLYGYTCDRDTFHVYLKDGVIHKVVYEYPNVRLVYATEDGMTENEYYVPSKRVYPEASDFEFCQMLFKLGISIPFTIFQDERPVKTYHGALDEDLVESEN